MLIVNCAASGAAESNAYIVGDGVRAVIIDAGAKASDIFRMAKDSGMRPEMALITHCHFDHIEYLDELRAAFGIPAYMHADDALGLADPYVSGAALYGSAKGFRPPDGTLADGEAIRAGSLEFIALHTPGHTPGGLCFLCGDTLFTGDTLFKGSVGRTDLPGGDTRTLLMSIHTKIMAREDGVVVYPGHGDATTIGEERRANPFLRI